MTRTTVGFLATLVLLAGATHARAIEVRCIEESKYKYLFELFEGDKRKFADYFGLPGDGRRLPDPEFCRAALVSGSTGEAGKDEFGDLVRMIVRNRGWLAAFYLSSSGGSGGPFEMAYLVRRMRLKTIVAKNAGNRIAYEPDFAPVEPAGTAAAAATQSSRCYLKSRFTAAPRPVRNATSGWVRPDGPPSKTFEPGIDSFGNYYKLVSLNTADPRVCQQQCENDKQCQAWTFVAPEPVLPGWERYRNAIRNVPSFAAPLNDECASSCSFIHAGGVDRRGTVKVHRPSAAHEFRDFEQRQAAGERVEHFYRHLDVGSELIGTWATTPAAMIRPATALRFPRYAADYLINKCGKEVEVLQRTDSQLSADQRRTVEQCLASELERARLAVYEKACAKGCDPGRLRAEVDAEIKRTVGPEPN